MLKCTKFDFRCGSATDPAWEAYSAPADHLAVFKGGGATSKGVDEVEGGEREKGKENGRRRGRDLPDQYETASYAPASSLT